MLCSFRVAAVLGVFLVVPPAEAAQLERLFAPGGLLDPSGAVPDPEVDRFVGGLLDEVADCIEADVEGIAGRVAAAPVFDIRDFFPPVVGCLQRLSARFPLAEAPPGAPVALMTASQSVSVAFRDWLGRAAEGSVDLEYARAAVGGLVWFLRDEAAERRGVTPPDEPF